MSLPTFIDMELEELVAEIFQYLKEREADIGEPEEDMAANLKKVVAFSDFCFKDEDLDTSEVEGFFNSVVSLILQVQGDAQEDIIREFCKKFLQGPKGLAVNFLRILCLLFHGLPDTSPLRHEVYYNMVVLAGIGDQMKAVFSTLRELNNQFKSCPMSTEQRQKLLRVLHDNLLQRGHTDTASQVLIELLKTYTSENASQAGEDAQKCIIASLADPTTYLVDHLLSLKPVKFLEGKPIHDLLSIFVSEKLHSYLKFYEQHKEFVNNCGLNHEANVHKMRLLTLLSMACQESELEFSSIQKELHISKEEVEQYIIDALKMQLMAARMDQSAGKLFVSSATSRTFGRSQWQQLSSILSTWQENCTYILDNMNQVVKAQYDMMQQQA